MAQQIINRGTVQGDGTGDTGFVGTGKINDNFTELYGDVSNNTSDITAQQQLTNTNIASQIIETPTIDWNADVQEYVRVWNAVNSGTGPFLIGNNVQVHYRTKRVVYTEIASQDNYDLIITTWREQKKYANIGVVSVGTGGSLTLSASNSNLYIDNVETYRVVNGTIVNGLVEDLGDIAGSTISEAVNALGTTIEVGQDEYLIVDNTGRQWIYIGQREVIGLGVVTADSEYRELTSVTADPAPTVSPSVKVFDVAGDSKFSADLLFQDKGGMVFTKNPTTGAIELDYNDFQAQVVDLVSDINLLINPPKIIQVLGFYEINDGGGGLFWWDASSNSTINDGIIIKLDSLASGRYRRVLDISKLNVKWFGARAYSGAITDPTGIVDSTDAINRAINWYFKTGAFGGWGIGTVHIPKGNYLVNGTLERAASPIGLIIEGDGQHATVLTTTLDNQVMFNLSTYINVTIKDLVVLHERNNNDQLTWTNKVFELNGQGGGRNLALYNISTYGFSRVIHHTNTINEDTTYVDGCTFTDCHTFLESENTQAVINNYSNFTLVGKIQRGFFVSGNYQSQIQNLNWVIDGTLIEYKNISGKFNSRGFTLINCKGEFTSAHAVFNTTPKLLTAIGTFIRVNVTLIDCSLSGGATPEANTLIMEIEGAQTKIKVTGGALRGKLKLTSSTSAQPERGSVISFENTEMDDPTNWDITDTGIGGVSLPPVIMNNVIVADAHPLNMVFNKTGSCYVNSNYSVAIGRSDAAITSLLGGTTVSVDYSTYGQNTYINSLKWYYKKGSTFAGRVVNIYSDLGRTTLIATFNIPDPSTIGEVYDITITGAKTTTEGLFYDVVTPAGAPTHEGYLIAEYKCF